MLQKSLTSTHSKRKIPQCRILPATGTEVHGHQGIGCRNHSGVCGKDHRVQGRKS